MQHRPAHRAAATKAWTLGWGCDQLDSSPISLAIGSGGELRAFLACRAVVDCGSRIIHCFLGYANLSLFAYACVIFGIAERLPRLCPIGGGKNGGSTTSSNDRRRNSSPHHEDQNRRMVSSARWR